jgi:hypothetical protein
MAELDFIILTEAKTSTDEAIYGTQPSAPPVVQMTLVRLATLKLQ